MGSTSYISPSTVHQNLAFQSPWERFKCHANYFAYLQELSGAAQDRGAAWKGCRPNTVGHLRPQNGKHLSGNQVIR